jgi:predicted MFS family arabinose efflux permease
MTAGPCPPLVEIAPDRRLPLLIAALTLTSTVGYIAMIQVLPVVLIPMANELGQSRTAIAAASTVSTLMGALTAFPIGRLFDRHGGRMLMAGGSALGAAAMLLWSQAASLAVLYSAFALIGVSIALTTYEAAFAVLVVVAEPHQRDRAILAVTMIAGLATYLVYPALGWMNSEFGWRTTLIALGAALAVTSVPTHLWVIPSRRAHRARVQKHTGAPLGETLRQSRFWLLLVAFVAQAGSVSAFLLLMVAYLLDVGYSPAVATAMPVAVGVLQILSRLVLTAFGPRLRMTAVTAGAFAIQGAGLLLLPLTGLSIPLTVLCVSAVGLGQGIGVIARPTILADNFGVTHFASALAVITVPMAVAKAGSPLLGAWLSDWRFLVISGCVALVGAVALLPLVHADHMLASESPAGR